ncbi:MULTISPECIES: hypothetical protein [unclassified Curtobacterium]|uniref:hypothetical protein n=1 Tax=unclassified Curtobacterium TaxID=257496 RepID=UPI0011B54ABA|nr:MULTISPECIES: hypothetical protein [unclassified Curtobacterium]
MNPAQRLHDRMIDWKERHATAMSVAASRDLETEEGMRDQMLALDDLHLVEQGLEELEREGVRVTTYRRYVPAWTRIVLSYPNGWTVGIRAEDVYPQTALDVLDGLADRWEDKRPSMSDEGKTLLREAVFETLSLVNQDQTLTPPLRLFINRLLREILAAWDDEVVGQRFDYEDAARRLWVCLFAAEAQSTSPERKAEWGDVIRRFFYDSAVSMIGNAPATVLAITSATGHS